MMLPALTVDKVTETQTKRQCFDSRQSPLKMTED